MAISLQKGGRVDLSKESTASVFRIALVILVGQFLIVQYGGAMFRTEPLSMETWGLILAGTSVVTVVRELAYQLSKIFK